MTRCYFGDSSVWEDASYLSKEDFEKLLDGDDEASLEVGLKYWRLVKLGQTTAPVLAVWRGLYVAIYMYNYDLRKRLSNYHLGGTRIKSIQITNNHQYLLTHNDILGRS